MQEESIINLVTALWFGAVGACVGSFVNVVAYRAPLGLSVVWEASRCPKCGSRIRAWHNVPIVGWLCLGGRCFDCRQPISPRYALIETIVGAGFLTLAYVELYSGGANLPGGPLTRSDDALDMFLRPSWPLLGVYAAHCTLFALLVCSALLHYDRLLAPPELAVLGMLVSLSLIAWMPQVLGHPSWGAAVSATGRWDATVGHTSGLMGASAAIVQLGCGAALLLQGRDARKWLNGALSVGLVGGVLGLTPGLCALAVWAATRGARLSAALVCGVALAFIIG